MRAGQKGVRASRYRQQTICGKPISCPEVSFSFPSEKRLGQTDVLAVLKDGLRLRRASFEIKFLLSPPEASVNAGKLAISVPKKLLKSAVARNRIKRLVREEFRAHRVTVARLHLLVIFRARNVARRSSERIPLRQELACLFNEIVSRAQTTTERTA